METQKFIRRPFDVNAVQVTPSNAADVAEWCGGTVSQSSYKLAGFDGVQLDSVMVPGNGPNAGKKVEARIGSWVVELDGKFRVLRKRQFQEMFTQPANDRRLFEPGDKVRDVSNGDEGTVELVDQVLVNFGALGQVLFSRDQLMLLEEFSQKTILRLKKEAELAGSLVNGLDQLDELRAQEEARVAAGDEMIHGVLTEAFEEAAAVTEVDGMRVGSEVRVTFEHNMFFGETGVVKSIDPDGRRMFVALNDRGEIDNIPFQPDELELNDVGWGNLKVKDVVETLIGKVCDAGYHVPSGTMARVMELTTSDLGGGIRVEFLNGAEGHYFADKLLKIDGFLMQDDMVETKRVLTNTVGTQMPVGTTGRVTVVDIDGEGSGESVEVLFSDGGYAHFRPSELKKL